MENKNVNQSGDSGRIDLDEAHEVAHWCKLLGVSEDELRDAVKKVGPGAEKIKRYLSLAQTA